MLETMAKKRAKGMISRPNEIGSAFHRAGRDAGNAEGVGDSAFSGQQESVPKMN
jgi:hypothetical protein